MLFANLLLINLFPAEKKNLMKTFVMEGGPQ